MEDIAQTMGEMKVKMDPLHMTLTVIPEVRFPERRKKRKHTLRPIIFKSVILFN
jgi:hypothetical protein